MHAPVLGTDALECAAPGTIAEQKRMACSQFCDQALELGGAWCAAAEKTSTIAPDPHSAKGRNADVAAPDPAMMKKRRLR